MIKKRRYLIKMKRKRMGLVRCCNVATRSMSADPLIKGKDTNLQKRDFNENSNLEYQQCAFAS